MLDEHMNIEAFEKLFSEQMRWAALFVSIREIAEENVFLVKDLSLFDQKSTIPLIGSLLTIPEYQSNCIRLEILTALAVVFCKGKKKAKISDLIRWFSQVGKSNCVIGEDPAEDVFVSLVHDSRGNYCLLEGVWEGAGFYTQRIFDVVSSMPDEGELGRIKRNCRAILVVSDIVCRKSELYRYQSGSDERHSSLSPKKIPKRYTLLSRVRVTRDELSKHGVDFDDIEPFILDTYMKNNIIWQQIGNSYLDFHPFIKDSKDSVFVALPSALSIALRQFFISKVIEGGLVSVFNGVLAKKYAELFFKTPLLGGPIHAPVHWQKFESFRMANFVSEIDKGYFISYHLFLPSVEVHSDGGFKSLYQDGGALSNMLMTSINDSVEKISTRSDFRKGQIVIVGCGWGKGYGIESVDFHHSGWRYQSISAADLIRLSWLESMSPAYFWRVQDGIEAAKKSGVNIVNVNGILNLIGWVRSNDGHLVPHSQIIDEHVSADQPLMLNPPSNLLCQIRAYADSGYDRHRAVDHLGRWHEVQRVSSEPLFVSESSQKLYASISDTDSGILTSVYEGTRLYWASIKTPNLVDKSIEYRLWEMINEWLHRIGKEIDLQTKYLKDSASLNVYIEFQDDDSAKEYRAKPDVESLMSSCAIESNEETNSCTLIFGHGFISGFSIAENIAENLFVLNLSKAYLEILGCKYSQFKAESVTKRVVKNQQARSFHIFHAQHFIDYVRDTLTEELVVINEIDDAAAKLGLGWRAMDKEQGNRIEGRDKCTKFLNTIVGILIDEVSESLNLYDRIHTLQRLIINCEKADVENTHWKRTAAAIIGLHGDSVETINQYVEQSSKFTGASIASRVLIEIALCACPLSNGKQISDIELSKLLAKISLVIRIGGLSNAIRFNALPPVITISSLGDILFKDDFGDLVVQPMLSRVLGDKFVSDAPSQRKNYDDPGFITSTKDRIDSEFWDVWLHEMQFDLDAARHIIGALEDKAISDHTAILMLTKTEYMATVCSDEVSAEVASHFLNQFSLATRPSWEKVPKSFLIKDIYPWEFGRRLSFVTRPILNVNNGTDPLLFIPPAALRKGFAHVVDGAYYGRLEQSFFRTEKMRNDWWGNAREGHSFNAKVTKCLSDAGWETRENIGLPEIFNQKTERNFGDVDVLAWRKDREEILIIECKDLSFARNYSEIASLLSDYQGVDIDGKADSLKKHLNRFHKLQDMIEKVAFFTGIHNPKLISCLICSGVVPMQYAKVEALNGTYVGSVNEVISMYS